MKAALVRWIALARRETQNYAHLLEHGWSVTGIACRRPDHDLSLLGIPAVQPTSTDYLLLKIPGLDSFARRLTGFEIHNLNYMLGLEPHLHGMDVVDLAETYHVFGYQIAKAKERLGYRLVTSVQENLPFTHERPGFRRNIKQAVFAASDHFLALSTMAKQSLILEGVPEAAVSVVPTMGVDTQVFKPAPKDRGWLERLDIGEDDLVILFVGRLTWSKGVFDLLYALKLLTVHSEAASARLVLLVVGDGPESASVQRTVEHLGLRDRVRLVNHVVYPDMPAVHNLADIFVLPSIPTPKWQEQFGAVLAESMASGKPIVGSGSGAIPEVVGDAGLIARANDYASLAECLRTLISSPRLRSELGERGRARAVREYDAREIGAKVRLVYERVLGDRQRASV